jgi:CTP:molybdopterin cytidylyltransferase MocA
MEAVVYLFAPELVETTTWEKRFFGSRLVKRRSWQRKVMIDVDGETVFEASVKNNAAEPDTCYVITGSAQVM